MNKNTLKLSFLAFVCIFSLFACNFENDENADSSLSDCPIINNKVSMVTKTPTFTEIQNLPTIKEYFETFDSHLKHYLDMEVTWYSPFDNYYIFDITIWDIVTKSSQNYKLGIMSTIPEYVNLIDIWGPNGQHFDASQLYMFVDIKEFFELAIKNVKQSKPKYDSDGTPIIQLGSYEAKTADRNVYLSLDSNGTGYFEGWDSNRVEWQQNKSKIIFKFYTPEDPEDPDFAQVIAEIISSTSFTLDGLTYNLVQE